MASLAVSLAVAILLTVHPTSADTTSTTKHSVLFIAVDDMRPSINAYNFSLAHTPNLDRLAATGTTFTRAYVQYAFCAPSRNSFMSGRRPDTTRVWNFQDHFREVGVGDKWQSMPEYFKNHGHLTAGSGKLYHPGVPPDNDWPRSWTTTAPLGRYYSPECLPIGHHTCKTCKHCAHSVPPGGAHQPGANRKSGSFHCLTSVPNKREYTLCAANTTKEESRFEYQLEDQRIRDSCVEQIKAAASTKSPFFVGCGFHKPHVPWIFPAEFLELYPSNLDDIPLAQDTFAPVDMPEIAWHYPADVHGMKIKFNGTANMTRARIYRRAYYAAISYTDYNIGILLDTLDDLGLTSSTAVAVIGDHGWQLGEHDTWAKMTNFELGVRIPMIVRAPWKAKSVGKVSRVLAEAVDLYPTLAALAGLPDPRAEGEGINGTNLAPVFDDVVETEGMKEAAFSQFAKPNRHKPFVYWPTPARNETDVMGYSVRTDEWRYTCWFGFDKVKIVPVVTDIIARELYDHRGDTCTGDLDWVGEHFNVANATANKETVAKLHALVLGYIRLYPVATE